MGWIALLCFAMVIVVPVPVLADSCPCQNGGSCTVSGTCACITGTSGDLCQNSICTMNGGPCQNNSTCSLLNATTNSYACVCTSDYSGQNCDQRVYTYKDLLYWKSRFDDLWNWTMKMGLPVSIALVVLLILVIVILIRKYQAQKIANARSTAMSDAMDAVAVLAGSSDQPITADHVQVLVNSVPASTPSAPTTTDTMNDVLNQASTSVTAVLGSTVDAIAGTGAKSTAAPPVRQIRSSRRASSPQRTEPARVS